MQLLGFLDLAQGAMAEHSSQKVRIHKNFIKEIMDKNCGAVLHQVGSQMDRNVVLTEINA